MTHHKLEELARELREAYYIHDESRMHSVIFKVPPKDRSAVLDFNEGELLHRMCSLEDTLAARKFADYGCNLDIRNKSNFTVLHRACMGNYYEFAEELCCLGADIEATDDVRSVPLLEFCADPRNVPCALLVASDADQLMHYAYRMDVDVMTDCGLSLSMVARGSAHSPADQTSTASFYTVALCVLVRPRPHSSNAA
eukprot:TRINITY_DN9439_c0_g1_i7.p1 TRINITY_DN9439_c0_g1~~TRINITY_DN9439_c0_g1_i7.p1  ORF type:complete len:197 (+),score=9.94 TRINITY_DN9439_c0_g1_i7:80-670(+)